ncbi:MAG: right-handed parallel beta-helix repeat-containing protein [Myxococcales bacterium]|nr:right-handed parallel beta-helix repeat-containing protein [Myxococcales bacterium]MCB9628903.1 right-handed parallel beta-helix repeat-containing protein [Sandaracinaceae bacterium]
MTVHLSSLVRAATVAAGTLAFGVAAVGCGGDSGGRFPANNCSDFDTANCVEIEGGDAAGLLAAVNALGDDTTIILGPGTFAMDNQVTIRGANGVNLVGQGMDETVLVFTGNTAQSNGIDVIADDFVVQDLHVLDAPKDGIRVEASTGVTFRRIRSSWTNPGRGTNGAYGIYPVRCFDVLVEDSEAINASDAGLYVGQCHRVVVRRNRVLDNVAGLEIENTEYADVYENHAEGNTMGFLVYDLPGNPVVGRDVHIHDNTARANNGRNFSPGGTVSLVPAGLGLVIASSRRVIVDGNTFEGNYAQDIAIASGLLIEQSEAAWELTPANIVGDFAELGLPAGATPGTVVNFAVTDVVVRNNTHMRVETRHDIVRQLGALISGAYDGATPAAVLYDGLGESMFNAADGSMTSNDANICVGENNATFVNIDVESQAAAPPFAPILYLQSDELFAYGCTSFTPALVPVEL